MYACGARSELDTFVDASLTSDADNDDRFVSDATTDVLADANLCSFCSGTCTDGRCVEMLAAGPARRLAVDGASVYWTSVPANDVTAGRVMRISIHGGTPTALAVGQRNALAIATDGTHVYWSVEFALLRAPVQGGTPQVIVPATDAYYVALDAMNLYWTTISVSAAAVLQAPHAGGAVTTVAAGQGLPQQIAVDKTTVYWTVVGSAPMYGAVLSAPIGGGVDYTTLAQFQYEPYAIAADSQHLYWTTYGDGNLSESPLDGGNATTLATKQPSPSAIALDETSMYWTTDGAVMKMPLGGGAVTVIASAQAQARCLALDATSVYWIAGKDADIMKATPK